MRKIKMLKDGEVRKLRGKDSREKSVSAEVTNNSFAVESGGNKKRRNREREQRRDSVAVGSVDKVKRKNKNEMVQKKKKRVDKSVMEAFGEGTFGLDQAKNDDKIVNGSSHVEGASDSSRKNKEKKKNRNHTSSNHGQQLKQEGIEAVEDDVLYMSSGDEDSSTGMKKWLTEYRDQRPGFEILQQRIDDFIVAHEDKLEQERREREARIAEDGWTVVEHHKGRKKTADTESGIVVGSVAQAAVLDKMSKQKHKGVGLDFYRFQKREAQRNQVIMLQSKFEEDKKRIQQLRAARKFRPY